MTRGMSLQPMQTFDNSITEEVVVHWILLIYKFKDIGLF
jgi:hypothetical protein